MIVHGVRASLIVLVRQISGAQAAPIARALPAWPTAPGRPAPPVLAAPVPGGPVPAAAPPTTPVSPQGTPGAGGTIGA